MNILFPAMHCDVLTDLRVVCEGVGANLYSSTNDSNFMCSILTASNLSDLKSPHTLYEEEKIKDLLNDRFFDFIFIMCHQQWELIPEIKKISPNIRVIYMQSGGTGFLAKTKELNVQNFFAPSQRAIEYVGCGHSFLYKKMMDWNRINRYPKVKRCGFFSFINKYEKFFKNSFEKFNSLNKILPEECKVINFGAGNGDNVPVVDDIEYMLKAKATVHLKDFGGVCNATTKSIACGTPILTDRSTYIEGYYDCIDGISVFDNIDGIRNEIIRINSDEEYKDSLSSRLTSIATEQFSFSKEYGDRFVNFLDSSL